MATVYDFLKTKCMRHSNQKGNIKIKNKVDKMCQIQRYDESSIMYIKMECKYLDFVYINHCNIYVYFVKLLHSILT